MPEDITETSGPVVELRDLTVRYGGTAALQDLTLTLGGGTICGLLGRNGAGKSTLLRTMAAYQPPTSGAIRLDGADVFEDRTAASRVRLFRDEPDMLGYHTVRQALDFTASLAPDWAPEVADRLLRRFRLAETKRVSALSRGGRAALNITAGLAARAPLTLFDEAHLGLDAVARYVFYDELLADYAAHPRTIVLSTHLIEEVATLLEEVVIVDEGRLLLHETADTLRARGVAVTGSATAVDRFTEGRTVLGEQRLGSTKRATVYGALGDKDEEQAATEGLELAPVPIQDLFVHLTADQEAA